MRYLSLLTLPLLSIACIPAPKVKTTLDPNAMHAAATARELDDMSFNVPPHSLERCTRVSMRLNPESDPNPELNGEFNPRLIYQGCENERNMAISSRRSLDVIGMHFDIDAEGHTREVRILDKVGEPEAGIQECLLANARRLPWPANKHGKPYEKHVYNVAYYTEIGTTTWKMIDAVRQLSDPRKAICECLRDQPPEQPIEFTMTFKLPASIDGVKATELVSPDTSPTGMCIAQAVRDELFEARGGEIDVSYVFHVDPSEPGVLEAVKSGQANLPSANEEPIVSTLGGKGTVVGGQ